MENNINKILKAHLCSGCGACAVACFKKCIHLVHGKSVNYPEVDKEQCVNCGKCIEVCPGNSLIRRFNKENEIDSFSHHHESYFVCHALDENIRKKAASGGFITAMISYLVENGFADGAIVVKQSEKDPLLNKVYIAKTKEDILKSSGSRYSPSSNCIKLEELKNEKGKYIFVGKPCDIEGAKNLQKTLPFLKDRIVLTVAIMCHHTPTRTGLINLLDEKGIEKEKIDTIRFRGEGWPGYFSVKKKDGSKIQLPYFEAWNNYLSKYNNLRCRVCDDPLSRQADITVGDPWGEEFKEENTGYSAVILRSGKAKEIYDILHINNIIDGREVKREDIERYQSNLLKRSKDMNIIRDAYNIVFKEKVKIEKTLKENKLEVKNYIKLVKYIIKFSHIKKRGTKDEYY